jgi:hypothetical protein
MMVGKWCKELLAIGMIGEGVAGLLTPKRYILLWRVGPKPYRRFMESLASYAGLMRLVFAVEAGLGVWLAWRQAEHVGDDTQSAGS